MLELIANLSGQDGLGDIPSVEKLFVDDGDPRLLIKVGDADNIHPVILCMVAALADYVIERGDVVELAPDNLETALLHRMDFFSAVHCSHVISPASSDPTGRYIPLTKVSNARAIGNFVTDFVPLLHATSEAATVKYVLHELLRNVTEHAGSAQGAYAAAQVTDDGRILVGVADAGIGVTASIRRFHGAADDAAAIELAMSPGVSGSTANIGGNETNGGAGLFFMKSMTSLSRQRMLLVSGTAIMGINPQEASAPVINASLADDSVTWGLMGRSYTGTAVGVDLALSSSTEFKNLLAEIGKVYHLNVASRKSERRKARFR